MTRQTQLRIISARARREGFDPQDCSLYSEAADRLDDMENALCMSLMFHRGGVWTEADRAVWKERTGEDVASTRTLCDYLRRVLAVESVATDGEEEVDHG